MNERYYLIPDAKQLDANSISTWFRNNGSFNYNPFNQSNPAFEWPKGTGQFWRFASGMWIGARVFNQQMNRYDTLVSVCYYQSEFLPGYTDNNGIPHGRDDPLYRVYRITLNQNDSDRVQWPNILLGNSDQGAPVYFDSLSRKWRPCDIAKQTMYYVYTDSYTESHNVAPGSTRPLKADVKQLNFSFDLNGPLGQVCFSQFTIINRNTVPWYNTYMALWSDDDIGLSSDDKVGCDSALNLGYTYNGATVDPIYGPNPPAVGFLLLRGAISHTAENNDTAYICSGTQKIARIGYRDLGMSSFNFFMNNAGPEDNPQNFRETYNLIQGLKRDGTCRINPNGNYCTRYAYSNYWIQPDMGDQRILASTGPVTINPNDTQLIIVVQLIARGATNIESILTLKQIAMFIQRIYGYCLWGCLPGPEIPAETIEHFKLYQNFPNPFNANTKISFDIADLETDRYPTVILEIYDVLGQEVGLPINKPMKPGSYDIEWQAGNYPSGVYFYELSVSYDAPQNIVYNKSKKMLLIK